jgi:hypothetical protein
MNTDITIVTGLWDLGREHLNSWAKRDFNYYKERFFEMLEVDVQMCIWIPSELKSEVEKIRADKPTRIFIKEVSDFETWNPFFSKIQEIRKNENWLSQAGWLRESPQAALESYNAMMFTKMFMLNDSAITNPFNSKYFYWIDGGLTNTVNKGYFQKDLVLNNLGNFMSQKDIKYVHLAYPYEGNTEIHGFERTAMAKYCNTEYVGYVCRGGFFGGEKDVIHQLNTLYYSIMENTLKSGYMGADECFFTILTHTYPNLIYKYDIEGNGLVWPFFEELKRYNEEFVKINKSSKTSIDNVGLYVITFNSPNQFETLVKSMLEYDKDFILKPKKFLLDNSTDLTTTPRYQELCEEYGFEHIKKDNLGIVGGRVFVAEHFNETDLDFYYWFEDDMNLYPKKGEVCRNGFNRYVDNLYQKSLEIIKKENFDFLKLSFSEFYGSNDIQFSWYNLPQDKRRELFPEKPTLPIQGLDPNAPRTKFKNIQTHKGLPYINGEIYLCNWPIVLTKEGNYKCYLETKWAHPYEQTLMSYSYQETVKGNINPGLLLLTPIEHHRYEFYSAELRKES